MANAEVVGEPKVMLELSMAEAEALVFVKRNVGGTPGGPRERIWDIGEALEVAGVVCENLRAGAGFDALYIEYK